MNPRWSFGMGVLLVAWAALAVRAQMSATKVMVTEARMVDAPATITLVGTVDAFRRSRVCSEIAGIVADMPARQGDFIEAGGVLCRLDDETIEWRLAEAKSKLGALTAKYDELRAGTRVEERARLKAVMEEAGAEYDRWKFEMQRIEALFEGRDSNAKEYTDTRASFLIAERRKQAAEADYEMAVNGHRKETIEQARLEVAEQQAVVDRIESDLRKTVIRAPFSGYVVQRLTEIGEWVAAGGPIAEMVDIHAVLVRVDVPEDAMPYVAVGQSARVQVDALRRAFSGNIRHVIRQGEERARTFPVEVEVDNPDGRLAGGMFARVTVPSGPSEKRLAVPKDAIVERDGIAHVGLVVPNAQGDAAGVLIPVTVGVDVNDWITVSSGSLEPGKMVVTHGNERLDVFPMPIQVVDENGNPVSVSVAGSEPRK
jgi:multidrug efflux pump subunit AcrA (membrane-fusion protein)